MEPATALCRLSFLSTDRAYALGPFVFPVAGPMTLDDIAEVTDGEISPSLVAQALEARDEAVAAAEAATAVGTTNDEVIAGRIVDDTSATKAALSDAIGAGVAEVVEVQPVAGGPNTIIAGHAANAIASDVERSIILGGGTSTYNNVVGGDGANVDTTTPNTTQTGTGAHVSLVGGYDNSAGQLSSKIISDHAKTEPGGSGHNAIYGGSGHVVKSTAAWSIVAGGIDNVMQGIYSLVSGARNTVSGTSSAAFGADSTVSSNYSFALGTGNTVSGIGAVAYGSTNTAAGHYGAATGNFAHSRFASQRAHTAGRFAALGDAQVSDMQMHKATTDATTTTLGIILSSTSYQLQPNQSAAFEALIVARVAGGTDTAAWKVTGCYRRGATGTPAAVGTPTITSLGADAGAATWAVAMSSDSAGGVNVRITGEVGKTIRWVQRVSFSEVIAA